MTIAQMFQKLGIYQWWQNVTWRFGQPGEFGTDFGLGAFGVPVGSITTGRVVYVGFGGYKPGTSVGYIVQILTSDGKLLHYQHLQSANVKVGDQVSIGTILGLGGGCPAGCYGKNPSCTCTDPYSTGQHIEVRLSNSYNPSGGVWGQKWIDPLSTFLAIVGSTFTGSDTPPVNIGNNPNAPPSKPCASYCNWLDLKCFADCVGTQVWGPAANAGQSVLDTGTAITQFGQMLQTFFSGLPGMLAIGGVAIFAGIVIIIGLKIALTSE